MGTAIRFLAKILAKSKRGNFTGKRAYGKVKRMYGTRKTISARGIARVAMCNHEKGDDWKRAFQEKCNLDNACGNERV